MTWEERVQAVGAFGFTPRQSGFLVTLMLHAGVCLRRQYCTYARITQGQKSQNFFRGLIDRRYASATRCGHNRARIYHLHHQPLYSAIGEPNNRHRKPMSLARGVERLMLLDAVLVERNVMWLATERDKLEYFSQVKSVPLRDLPALTFGAGEKKTVRYFTDKLPIGVSADRRSHVFLYLLDRPTPIDFRQFLERHGELFRALPAWCVRLLVPRHLTQATDHYAAAFLEQLGMPLQLDTRDELRWYFEARRSGGSTTDQRFRDACRVFGSPRFQAVFRTWREVGDAVLEATVSPVLSDAISRGDGKLDRQLLSHHYLHLSPLVATA